jgi:hypothetical protein
MKIFRYHILAACGIAASAMAQNAYVSTVLVANDPKYHPQLIDKNMVDAWGVAIRPPGAGGDISGSQTLPPVLPSNTSGM